MKHQYFGWKRQSPHYKKHFSFGLLSNMQYSYYIKGKYLPLHTYTYISSSSWIIKLIMWVYFCCNFLLPFTLLSLNDTICFETMKYLFCDRSHLKKDLICKMQYFTTESRSKIFPNKIMKLRKIIIFQKKLLHNFEHSINSSLLLNLQKPILSSCQYSIFELGIIVLAIFAQE